jgi:hypothetical protein
MILFIFSFAGFYFTSNDLASLVLIDLTFDCQGQAYVKHLIDRSEELLLRGSLTPAVQVSHLGNQTRATDMRVDELNSRVQRLESVVDLSFAEFAEEQDGRINQELVFLFLIHLVFGFC